MPMKVSISKTLCSGRSLFARLLNILDELFDRVFTVMVDQLLFPARNDIVSLDEPRVGSHASAV